MRAGRGGIESVCPAGTGPENGGMRASPACRSASSERVLGRASLAAAVLISAAWLGSCAKLRGMKVAPKKDPKATPDAAPPPAGPTAKAPPEAPPAKRPDTPTAPTAPAASTRPGRKRLALLRKRVLFIGNSYTSHNDMPLMLQKLAEAAHEQERVHFKRFTVGGCTLEKHWLRTGARLEVRKSTWDYVVLQEQSMRPIERRELMHKYARLFGAEIMMAEAKTVFFLTWPRQHRPHDQEALTDACVSIAKELKAQVAPQAGGEPMQITTTHAVARVVGTRFRLIAGEADSRVRVLEGRVTFDHRASDRSVTLSKHQV